MSGGLLLPSVSFPIFFRFIHFSQIYAWQSVLGLFSGEGNEEKKEEILGFIIEERDSDVASPSLLDVVVNGFSSKRCNVDEENSLPLIIFRDLLSMVSVSSVKSSSLRHVSVSGYSLRHWRAFPGAAFPKSSCFHKFCQVDYLIIHQCRVTSSRLSWPPDQHAHGGRGS